VKLCFLGTPEIAVTPLRGLVAAGHDIELVVTNADARRGRGKDASPSPVKAAALELGLRVSHDAADIADAADVADVADSGAELGIVVAYGHILRPNVLDVMPFVNLHFSLLPRWRGAAPVERAILAGDELTGVCVMAVEEGLDTGGVYASATTAVGTKTLQQLWSELSVTGTELLVDWLTTFTGRADLPTAEPQHGEVTHAAKLTAQDRRLDLAAPAHQQLAVIRLGNAWTEVGAKRLKVLDAQIDDQGALRVLEVQPEGKRPMAFDQWSRGVPPEQRAIFG